jgi:hypothetical protein
MSINSTITTDGSVHATIAGFAGVMYLTDVDPPLEFATIDFPETSSDALVLVNVTQHIPVDNQTALTIFNTHLLTKDVVHVKISGPTTARVSGIARDYPVTFEKDVDIVGFNSFAGLAVVDPHITLVTKNNFNATATIPNPTIWNLDVVSLPNLSYPFKNANPVAKN